MAHALHHDRDVGHQQSKVVRGKAAGNTHAGQQQLAGADPVLVVETLHVDGKKLAETRADDAEVDGPVEPGVHYRVERLGCSRQRKAVVAWRDRDWHLYVRKAAANQLERDGHVALRRLTGCRFGLCGGSGSRRAGFFPDGFDANRTRCLAMDNLCYVVVPVDRRLRSIVSPPTNGCIVSVY